MKIFMLLTLWSMWFLNFATRTGISPLLPIIEDELAISHALAGSLFLFMSIGFTISVFMSGLLCRFIGYKRSIVSGYTALVLVLISTQYAETYYALSVITFLIGLSSGIYFPCAVPLITSVFSRENWGKAVGFHEMAVSFNFILTPILITFILRYYQWKTYFIVIAGACLISVILLWILAPDPPPRQVRRGSYITLLRRKEIWLMIIFWSISATTAAGIYTVIPLFLVNEKGLQLDLANTIFGISRIGGLFATVLIGFIVDRYDLRKIIFVILLIGGLSTIGMALAQAFWLLVCMLVIQATVSVAFFPAAIVGISDITRLEERSTFTGITLSVSSIFGLGIFPVSLGMVADRWNFQVGILIMGIITTMTCLLVKWLKN
jgi:NNP family nitrate/nitrite transporter-like MFS transporter